MAIEYRGCKKLVYAEVVTDTAEGMTFGEVKPLAPVQQVQREVSRSTATTYYDDVAANTTVAEGAEVNNFIIGVPSDEVMGDIEGKYYDPTTKIYSDSPISNKYFAVGYILGEEGDAVDEQYCWKIKGTFQVSGTEHNTKNDGTDTTNVTLAYTSVYPLAQFEHGGADGKGGASKGVRIKKSAGIATESEFFAKVQTVDDIYGMANA